MYLATLTSSNSSPKAVAKEPQSSTPSVVAVTFSPTEDITFAFIKLSAEIKKMIENSNLDTLQEACIEKASSPESFMSTELVPKIKATQTFRALCSMLADTTYWNFLDTRMMEAMVTASMIPAAQQTMENFKKAFFSMKLSEVVPYYVPVIPLKFGYTEVEEVIDKDPREFTIGELHSHRFYLETELFKTGSGTLRYYKIMVGSVIIVWQIHVDDVYQAYTSLQNLQLPPQSIIHLTIPQTVEWIGIPILWRGQEMKKIGPIEMLEDSTSHKPYVLPDNFEWMFLTSGKLDEVTELCIELRVPSIMLQWTVLHPHFKKEFIFGVRKSDNKQLLWLVGLVTSCLIINGKRLPLIVMEEQRSHNDIKTLSLHRLVFREAMRIANLSKIYQIVIGSRAPEIIKPVATLTVWYYSFPYPFSPVHESPKTVGLRRMRQKHIPKALSLTNKYASQFEIGHVFQTEDEFSHHFLCSPLPDYIITYVVEDPITGNVTDMFSFDIIRGEKVYAGVNAIVAATTPPRQLITDMLMCIHKEGVEIVSTLQYGLNKKYFDGFFSQLPIPRCQYIHLCNYNYPEVDEDKCCLFHIHHF